MRDNVTVEADRWLQERRELEAEENGLRPAAIVTSCMLLAIVLLVAVIVGMAR